MYLTRTEGIRASSDVKIISVSGVVEKKLLQELETEQMRLVFETEKLMQVLGKADCRC